MRNVKVEYGEVWPKPYPLHSTFNFYFLTFNLQPVLHRGVIHTANRGPS
ncbi:hypothetical protein SAMN04488505_1021023 [Chitinophaga rupis]|uniref:Uncharacterized protein n=1 Tax=Chitinophaga rupis TaxID=573321 RepID=A0A1H7SV28_9BACT|nr:hypothetical protein SAMN04488505_1021023 [Chitinophaga rupis]